MEEDPELESDNFLQIIEKIEKENLPIARNAPNMQNQVEVPNKPSVNNYNQFFQNVTQSRSPAFPHMFFPNSNVTINYNFNKEASWLHAELFLFVTVVAVVRTGLVKFEKLSFSYIPLIEVLGFKVLHAYVTIRIKEVIEVQIFSSFNTSIFPFAPLKIHSSHIY